jgi:outer membrane lipoprotein SlyB
MPRLQEAKMLRPLTLAVALVTTSAGFGLLPTEAAAQPAAQRRAVSPMPRVTALEVKPVDRIEPGADLEFTLWGTPGAVATLEIEGTRRPLTLYEASPGIYRGTYTVARRDRIVAESRVTANLRRDNRVATAVLGQSLQADWPSPVASAPQPQISQVRVADGGRRNPNLLRFTLLGTPGGHASVHIQGTNPRVLVLEEVRPGEYTGEHLLQAGARLATDRPLVARLRVGDRVASSSVDNAYQNVSLRGRGDAWCGECGVVEAVNVVEVDGNGKVIGTVAGGVIGALLGSQIGKGDGRTAAGVAGAVGGALIGREIARRGHSTQYEVVVRLNEGERKVVMYQATPPVKVGDSVRLVNDGLELRRG